MTARCDAILVPADGQPRWIDLDRDNAVPELRALVGGGMDVSVLSREWGFQLAVYEWSVRESPVNLIASGLAALYGKPYKLHGDVVVFGFDPADGETRSLQPREWITFAGPKSAAP
jgi:hypothetical protein